MYQIISIFEYFNICYILYTFLKKAIKCNTKHNSHSTIWTVFYKTLLIIVFFWTNAPKSDWATDCERNNSRKFRKSFLFLLLETCLGPFFSFFHWDLFFLKSQWMWKNLKVWWIRCSWFSMFPLHFAVLFHLQYFWKM